MSALVHPHSDGRRALVRRPSPRLADGLLTHLDRTPVDPDLALRQWAGYVAVLADSGWAVTEIEPVVDDAGRFETFLAVPEEPGAHVVLLGEDRLLMSARAPRTAALLEGLGYTVVPVDISEFEKLEGCVTCLSVRMRGLP